MNNAEFSLSAEKIFDKIVDDIEKIDKEGKIDVDLNSGVLTLENEDGIFVINKQSSVQEIWLSSPISGPYHFTFLDNKWITRYGIEMFGLLSKELQIKIENV